METPFGDFVIGAALADAFAKRIELDTQETAHVAIETEGMAEVRMVLHGEFTALVQPDFIEQPTEKIKAAHALAGTTEGRVEHRRSYHLHPLAVEHGVDYSSGHGYAWRMGLVAEDDEIAFDWPVNFEASKDKPVLFTALACADVLLTLDRRDFGDLPGKTIYGLRVLTPGAFLHGEREAGRLR